MVKLEIEEPLEEEIGSLNKRLRNPNNLQQLAKDVQGFKAMTKCHIDKYFEAGLRTLVLAYRVLREEECKIRDDKFSLAKCALSVDHDAMVESAAEKIERDLILLGTTAVEDRSQKEVPECINKLSKAGIEIWVLTGDKLETAVNIGFFYHLLRKGMNQIIIRLDELETGSYKKERDKKFIEKASHENIARQLREAQSQLSQGSYSPCALIIDRSSLAFALSRNP